MNNLGACFPFPNNPPPGNANKNNSVCVNGFSSGTFKKLRNCDLPTLKVPSSKPKKLFFIGATALAFGIPFVPKATKSTVGFNCGCTWPKSVRVLPDTKPPGITPTGCCICFFISSCLAASSLSKSFCCLLKLSICSICSNCALVVIIVFPDIKSLIGTLLIFFLCSSRLVLSAPETPPLSICLLISVNNCAFASTAACSWGDLDVLLSGALALTVSSKLFVPCVSSILNDSPLKAS